MGTSNTLSAAAVANNPIQDPLPSAILWKIEKPGNKQVSYLMGTIHMIPTEDFFFTPAMQKALLETKKVIFELDIDELQDQSVLLRMMGQLMMPNDTSVQDLLSAEQYAEVSGFFANFGLPMDFMGKMKPMVLSMIAESPDVMQAQSAEFKSYEIEISERAKLAGKELGALESIEYQLGIFDKVPYKVQAQMLYESIHNLKAEDANAGMDAIVQLYKKQDLEGIKKMIGAGAEALGPFEKLLVDNRNAEWIPKMEAEMSKGSMFFAVGAGHLPGDSGLLTLLQKAGYKLSPVKID